MGTSSSYGGPGDRTPLLPSWALPGGDGGDDNAGDGDNANDGQDNAGEDGGDGDSKDGGGDGDGPGEDGGGEDGSSPDSSGQSPTQSATAHTPASWQSAKTLLGRAVSSRGGSSGYGRAAKAYVRALGGHRSAATSGRSARSSTRALGGFLSDVRNHGFAGALDRIGLRELVGKDVHAVFAALVDAIAPEGVTREEVAAREAVCETLADLFGQFVVADPTGAALAQAMTPDGVRGALESCVVSAAFNRWLDDLARQIEAKAISAAEALKAERDIHQYMVDTVKLDFAGRDPLSIEWKTDGQALIDRLYDDAYRMLEGEQ